MRPSAADVGSRIEDLGLIATQHRQLLGRRADRTAKQTSMAGLVNPADQPCTPGWW
jgi:hypothetical protein